VKVELKKDLIQVRYNAEKATPEALVRAVDKEGFQAKVVSGPAAAP
jgi:hypothetical protein